MTAQSNSSTKRQILVVDDNLEFFETLVDYLNDQTSYQIVHVKSGKLALDYLRTGHRSVVGVLSDIMMSGGDGIDLLAQIRQSPDFARLPLIFISGSDVSMFASLLKPYQYSAFVKKPADFNKLLLLIEHHFGKPSRQSGRVAA